MPGISDRTSVEELTQRGLDRTADNMLHLEPFIAREALQAADTCG